MKNILSHLLLTVSTVLISVGIFAQKQTPPSGGTPKDFVIPAKKQAALPNGMRTIMVPYGATPKVYVNLIIKTGKVHESAHQIWLARLLARLMNEGTPSLNATELAKKVAGMGGEISVAAGDDQFFISGSSLSEYAPDLIKLIADLAINPALPAKELNRLKADLKRSLALSKTVPQDIANERFDKLMYDSASYGNTFPTEAMLDGYKLEDAQTFYKNNMGAQRAVLYVAGWFDEVAAAEAAATSFSKWKPGPAPAYPVIHYTPVPGTTIVDRKGAPQTTVIMGLPVITPHNPDYLALTVMNSLLGGSFASRITGNIRENKGYTYSPFSGFSVHPGAATWFEQADITSEHTMAAIREIKNEIGKLQNEPPDIEELTGIQRYMAGIFVLQNSSPKGIISQLNFLDLYGLDDSYLTNRVKNIYSVTSRQISDLAQKYLPVEKMTIVMVGDEKAIKEQQ